MICPMRIPFRFFIPLALTLAIEGVTTSARAQEEPGALRMLAASDLHFTPFGDTALVLHLLLGAPSPAVPAASANTAQYGSETDSRLLERLLSDMRQQAAHPTAILLPGDLLAHGLDDSVRKYARDTTAANLRHIHLAILAYVRGRIQANFPGVPVLYSLGNNDSYDGDYAVEDDGSFLREASGHLFGAPGERLPETFAHHGYGRLPLPGVPGARLLILNTTFFSSRFPGPVRSGQAELEWLEKELAAARREHVHVWLELHIPPGMDAYASWKRGAPVALWQPDANRRVLELLREYRNVVSAAFAGHLHRNEFRSVLRADGTPAAAIHAVPAVSSIFGNNPAFQILEVDVRSGKLRDAVTFALDLAARDSLFREEFRFSKRYGNLPDAAGYARLDTLLSSSTAVRTDFQKAFGGGSAHAIPSGYWRFEACVLGHLDPESYETCLQKTPVP